nr:hypothetical protein [Tanacetum cinerariifolium]
RIPKNLLDRVLQLHYPFSLLKRLKVDNTVRLNRNKNTHTPPLTGHHRRCWKTFLANPKNTPRHPIYSIPYATRHHAPPTTSVPTLAAAATTSNTITTSLPPSTPQPAPHLAVITTPPLSPSTAGHTTTYNTTTAATSHHQGKHERVRLGEQETCKGTFGIADLHQGRRLSSTTSLPTSSSPTPPPPVTVVTLTAALAVIFTTQPP